jgi:hypothetical protein
VFAAPVLVRALGGGWQRAAAAALAKDLVERGHDVRVLTEDCLAADVAAAGCRFEPFVEVPNRASCTEDLIRDSEARTPLDAFARATAW